MKYLVYIPGLVYLIFILININILGESSEINLFWITTLNLPITLIISIFFVLYIAFIFLVFNFKGLYSQIQNKHLRDEVYKLKSKLLEGQDGLIKAMEQSFENTLNKQELEGEKRLEKLISAQEKQITKLMSEISSLESKIRDIKKEK